MSDETARDLEGEIMHLRRSLNRAYELNDFYKENNLILERGLERQRRTWEKTAAQALRAATAQPAITPRSETAYYLWALAFKYLWRLWTKGQAQSDLRKCRDCLDRLEREVCYGDDEA